MIDLAKARTRLEAQLAELEERLGNIERDLDEPHDTDSSERAVQMEDDEALEAQAALVTSEIASTRRALVRVADGTYGECMNCGADISENRLDARPESALCITCASAKG
ncbi:TraR/DksA family transcriptional regulator [Croceibacterium aestuarii]|uniref:TraR/DksA family transcriptional regulator n=1 Tax=Croceibacterium aestuarii TaxID=3064139 RepID=UPI00272EC6A6|nr:TraR/DksA C4-type zinc finger protein [Croceibacterium sp. D39]